MTTADTRVADAKLADTKIEDLVSQQELLDNLLEGVYVVDHNRKIVYWNRGAEQITGYARSAVLGTNCWDHILRYVDRNGNDVCVSGCPLKGAMEENEANDLEVFLHHKDGHRLPVLMRSVPKRNGEGQIIGAIEIFYENFSPVLLTERLRELERLSFIDPLTNVANRRYLEISLEAHIDRIRRYGGGVGVVFIDVDDFKAVNDTHGHGTGDRALQLVANNLLHNSRSFDLCGRWGGEEFVVLCENVGTETLSAIAERYRMLVEASSLPVGSDSLKMTVSIGATLAQSNSTVATLMQRADTLMYESKKAGKNRVTLG